MSFPISRRSFLNQSACTGAALISSGVAATSWTSAGASEPVHPIPPFGEAVSIAGSARQRGKEYGRRFSDGIRDFIENEIFTALGNVATKDDMLRYADACWKVIRSDCPEIAEELEGMAEGSGQRLENHVLLTLHEELYHRGVLPSVPHCTAVAIGKPLTKNQETLCGQTWDWMTRLAGVSRMVEWKRAEGPHVLGYGYPGLWVGAGLNANGLSLCWTSADLGTWGGDRGARGPRVGLPSYVLLTHLLYQNNLDEVRRIAERNRHAGWFTFVMADANGRLMNIEGSPEGIEVEEYTGRLARAYFGTRKMNKTPEGKEVVLHPRCVKMYKYLDHAGNQMDISTLKDAFANRETGVCGGPGTIDMMIFDTTHRTAHASRGADWGIAWKEYRFS